jgi:SAM-dependent methyltransferase
VTPAWSLDDEGDERVLTVDGVPHRTRYSARVIRMLVERKGAHRAPLYFPFKETRGRHFLARLFAYLRARGVEGVRVLEVGCSFGHITEYLDDEPLVRSIVTFDVDAAFAAITRAQVEDQGLRHVERVLHLPDAATRPLPFADAAFDLVLVIGVIEHLPYRGRHRYVDEYFRVLAPGGHIAILDTPNRAFPFETHSVGLPAIQWLPAALAYRYARTFHPPVRRMTPDEFDAGAWRNASLAECLPSDGAAGLVDVTEEAGYGWRFFRDTARSRTRRAMLPVFALACRALEAGGRPPSLALPYFNLLMRKEERGATTRR